MTTQMVPRVPPKNCTEIEELSRKVLHVSFGHFQNSIQPQAYAKCFDKGGLTKLGLKYGVVELPFGEEARFDPGENSILLSPETYDMLYADKPRARFTFAHELGHAVMHGNYLKEALAGRVPRIMYKRASIQAFCDPEWQANTFAASFLMPANVFRQCVSEGMKQWDLSRYFRASPTAIQIRMAKLGLK